MDTTASFWSAQIFSIIFLIAISNGSPSRIQSLQLHRMRRAAESSTEPVPESAPSTPFTSSPPSTMTMSPQSTPLPVSLSTMKTSIPGHESHEEDCSGDIATVKKTCPDNSTCPLDEGNMEKCCHCLNTCCAFTSSSSEETVMGSSTMKPGKDIGSKVKDAVNSAEGWIKNAGENIKNSWNKAKDSISSAASDVSDKVKKGINSVANRVKNATTNNQSDCKSKDGKCVTDKTTTDSNSDDSTPVPGFQKSKRDVHGRGRTSLYSPYSYSQVSPYDSRYSGSGYGNRDSSDSREYSWSKTTTTSRDSNNRRYKRETESRGNKNFSSTDNLSSTNTQKPSEKSNGRNKRASGSGISFSENSRYYGGDCSTNSNSWQNSGRNSRQERESPNQGGMKNVNANSDRTRSFQQSGSVNGQEDAMRRTRRGSETTEKAQMNMTTVTAPSKRDKRENKGKSGVGDSTNGSTTEVPSNEDSEEGSEGSSEGQYYKDHGYGFNGNDKFSQRQRGDDSNYSISVKVLGPKGSNETRYSFTTGERSDSDSNSNEQNDNHHYDHNHDDHPSHNHRGAGGRERYQVYRQSTSLKEHVSKNSNDKYDSAMDQRTSSHHFGNGGGVISGPQSNGRVYSSRGNEGNINQGGRSFSFNQATDNSNQFNHDNQEHGNSHHEGRQGQDLDFSNRGQIRSTGNDGGYYEPYGSSSSGMDVAYYPSMHQNRPDSLAGQNSMYYRSSGRQSYFNPNPRQQNTRHYLSSIGQDEGSYIPHENDSDHYGWGGNGNDNTPANANRNRNNNDGLNMPETGGTSFYGEPNSNWGHTNSQSYDQSESGISSSSGSISSNSNPNDIAYGKPGKCKPLVSGVHCLPLQPDSAQCLFDKDCSGPKKCCFYGCKPNKSVGICEYPVEGYGGSNSNHDHGHHHDHGY